ncbi:MAG: hypothetical protein ACK44R_13450, partial [Burkholderiales bacterium]
ALALANEFGVMNHGLRITCLSLMADGKYHSHIGLSVIFIKCHIHLPPLARTAIESYCLRFEQMQMDR